MTMQTGISRQAVYAFFRMGLVTGLVQPDEVIAWADARLLEAEGAPDYDLVELSMAARHTLSQLAGLLNQLQGEHVKYPAALELLFDRARQRLEEHPESAAVLVYDLKLLLSEYHLPQATRAALNRLDAAGLSAFLDGE